jgi:hypothetical protein
VINNKVSLNGQQSKKIIGGINMANIKALSTSSTWEYATTIKDGPMGDPLIIKALNRMKVEGNGVVYVTEEMLSDVIYKMSHKNFRYIGKNTILTLYKKGIIQIVFSEDRDLHAGIPFFTKRNSNGSLSVVINIAPHATMRQDGTINMSPELLYIMMLCGAYSLKINDTITSNIDGVNELYASMFVGVIGKMFHLDKTKEDKIKFVASKFFLLSIFGPEFEAQSVEKSMRMIKRVDPMVIRSMDVELTADYYMNLEALIDGLKMYFPEFTTLSLRSFVSSWINSYGVPAMFATEYAPYFYYVIGLVIAKINIVKVISIERNAPSSIAAVFYKMEKTVADLLR